MKHFLFSVCSFIGFTSFAHGDTSSENRFCIFRKPLEIGSSITARTPELPFYQTWTRWRDNASNHRYFGSPSMYFIEEARAQDPRFQAFEFTWGKNKRENLAAYRTPVGFSAKLGGGQVHELLYGRNRTLFDQSSILVGVDLFYHDALLDSLNCGYGRPIHHSGFRERVDAEAAIVALTEAAFSRKKVLFLGNLPEEDPDLVKVKEFWEGQNFKCVQSINDTLRRHCKVSKGCYLLDFAKLVEQMKSDRSLNVPRYGRAFTYDELRPDGLHLSAVGSQYVADIMREQFERGSTLPCPEESNSI